MVAPTPAAWAVLSPAEAKALTDVTHGTAIGVPYRSPEALRLLQLGCLRPQSLAWVHQPTSLGRDVADLIVAKKSTPTGCECSSYDV